MKKMRESRSHERYMSEADAKELIASHDGDDVASYDIIDEETNEVFLEEGQPFHTSPLSPEHVPDDKRAIHDEQYARRVGMWDEIYGDDIDDDDDVDEKETSRAEYEAAVKEFCDGFTGFADDAGDSYDSESTDVAADAAADGAEGFFAVYPDWRRWAFDLGMTRVEMKDAIADLAYEAMKLTRESVITLKSLLKEASYPTAASARAFVRSRDPDEISAEDVIDDETGEVHASAGQRYRDNASHPGKADARLSAMLADDAGASSEMPSDVTSADQAFKDMTEAIVAYRSSGRADSAGFFLENPMWRSWSIATGMSRKEIADMFNDVA